MLVVAVTGRCLDSLVWVLWEAGHGKELGGDNLKAAYEAREKDIGHGGLLRKDLVLGITFSKQ